MLDQSFYITHKLYTTNILLQILDSHKSIQIIEMADFRRKRCQWILAHREANERNGFLA